MSRIKLKKHNCKVCGEETWGRECNLCKAKRYSLKKKEKPFKKGFKPLKKKRKSTGEKALFEEIWNERPHISEVSGKPLIEFDVRFFSHVIPKSTYPLFRFNKENIVLKTPQEHNDWQFSQYKLVDDERWKFVFEKKEKLIREYYETFYGKKYE